MQYFGFDRPSFGIKTFGFGVSNSKISADFTTGTYKASGAAKTFADLFTFTRAGKAWLVKDTGLQEYAADVPRFDNGLLIEQSATNLLYSDLFLGASTDTGVTYSYASTSNSLNVVVAPSATAQLHRLLSKTDLTSQGTGSINYSYYPELSSDRSFYVGSDDTGAPLNGIKFNKDSVLAVGNSTVNVKYGSKISFTGALTASSLSKRFVIALLSASDDTRFINTKQADITLRYLQVELNYDTSSYIKSIATPVTRPADFITNKITGTSVTGDWDGTLTLSIVNGKLVHSGYGRIRSLEIS